MINYKKIVGNFFEEKVSRLFNLEKIVDDTKPDLAPKSRKFYMEVKASSYLNGGVIKQGQLERFDKSIDEKRFYAFCYHSITKCMEKTYSTERELRAALDLRSLYIFPFSVVKAFYQRSNKVQVQGHFAYVQMREHHAKKIFLDTNIKSSFGLNDNYNYYKRGNIHIMTNQGEFEKVLIDAAFPGIYPG